MKARHFFGKPVYSPWAKLYVLTEDGTLYSEYLDCMRTTKDIQKVDFETFNAEDYKWSGYQSLEEIDYETAINKPLTRQSNWVQRYLDTKENDPKTDIKNQ